jgi:undecaprenyl-diphosphatase
MLDSVAAHILTLPAWLTLLLVFALPALEASAFVGFVFPGEIACLLGGVAAYQHHVSLAAVATVAVVGAIVGDSVGYAVGRTVGVKLLDRLPKRLLKPDHVEQGRAAIRRFGGKAVFVGRFAAALRVLVPGLSGIAGLRYRTFLIWNVAGGLIWATGSVLLGYAAGASWRHLSHQISTTGWWVAGVVILALVIRSVVRRRRRRRTPNRERVRAGR